MTDLKKFSIILFMGLAITIFSHGIHAEASTKKPATPENLVVKRYSNRALRLTWKKVKDADGYRIYRYSKKQEKYVAVKTIIKAKKTSWINKNLGFHKIYRYKIAAFKVVNGRKKFSKRTYMVTARTYAGKGRRVNAEHVRIYTDDGKQIGTHSETYLSLSFDGDSFVRNSLTAKVISQKVVWSTSDPSMAKVNQDGKLTTFNKAGTCYVYVRAHNGISKKIRLNIVNYARPDSFPGYTGNLRYINELLMNYSNEVYNIAEYFTQYGNKDKKGLISEEDDGTITGYPAENTFSQIKADVDKIIKNMSRVVEIQYLGRYVSFRMLGDVYGDSYTELGYNPDYDFSASPFQIAPHWYAKSFAPN